MKKNKYVFHLFIFFGTISLNIQASNNTRLSSHQEKRKFIAQKLAKVNCNLDFLARAFRYKNEQEITQHIDLAKKLAQENNSSEVTMRNFEIAIDEIEGGPKIGFWHPMIFWNKQNRYETAIHEAGHIVAAVQHPKLIALFGSIAHRKNSAGYHVAIPTSEVCADFTDKDVKMLMIEMMAGPVAEQVFNIQDHSFLSRCYRSIFKQKDNFSIELSLTELINRRSAQQDMESVRKVLLALVEDKQISEENLESTANSLYLQTLKLVQDHIKEIKALALELDQNTYISSDKIYEICQKNRPKLDIEKE